MGKVIKRVALPVALGFGAGALGASLFGGAAASAAPSSFLAKGFLGGGPAFGAGTTGGGFFSSAGSFISKAISPISSALRSPAGQLLTTGISVAGDISSAMAETRIADLQEQDLEIQQDARRIRIGQEQLALKEESDAIRARIRRLLPGSSRTALLRELDSDTREALGNLGKNFSFESQSNQLERNFARLAGRSAMRSGIITATSRSLLNVSRIGS